jgi:PBP1b-binding outer membrane lipoprotein LpoB
MKKILTLALLAIVFAGCKNEKKYKENFGQTLDNMATITALSAVYVDAIANVWKTAIYDKEYRGSYCKDFNDALSDYIPKLQAYKEYDELKNNTNNLRLEVKELSDYPSKYKDAYNEIAELTSLVDEFFRLASTPTGSLTSYSSRTKELFTQINNKISTMRLKYVDVK